MPACRQAGKRVITMTEQQRPGAQDIYSFNDERRQRLQDDPSCVVIDNRGRNVSLLLEQHGNLHLAFARIDEEGRPCVERAASGDSLKYALIGIGPGIYPRYVMQTTGEVPREVGVFKADSF